MSKEYVHISEAAEISEALFSNAEFAGLLRSVAEDSAQRLAPGGVWIEELSVSDVPREAAQT
jgi:hypothetical protein